MAYSRPVSAIRSLNAVASEVKNRYPQVLTRSTMPTMMLAATGVANRRFTLARNSGSTRWLAIP